MRGALDAVREHCAIGWAYDEEIPGEKVQLRLLVDGIDTGIGALADLPRPDLARLGIADSARGFSLALPERFRDGRVHDVSLRVERSGRLLAGSPKRYQAEVPLQDGPRTEGALVGRENWLFLCNDSNDGLAQYRGERRLGPAELDSYLSLFTARGEYFSKLGLPYLFAIVPGKERVHPEFLPEGLARSPLALPAEQLMHLLLSRTAIEAIDLLPSVMDAKWQGPVFYRSDSHWNHHGALAAAAAIIGRVRRHFPAVPAIELPDYDWKELPFEHGDLRDKLKHRWTPQGAVPERQQPAVPPETLLRPASRRARRVRRVATPPALQLSKTRETLVFETGDPALPSCLMFRDSFADWMVHLLAPCFRRIVYVWQPEVARAVVEQERPDLVLHAVIDRFLVLPPSH